MSSEAAGERAGMGISCHFTFISECVQLVSWKGQLSLLPIIITKIG